MVVHVLSVAFTAAVMYLSVPGTDLFSWHPTCMAVGFVLLANQAIMVFSKESGLFPTSTRSEKITLHLILNVFALVSILFGFGAVYINKEVNKRSHFSTWHGKIGLAAVIGVLGAAVGGAINKNSQKFKRFIRPANIKIYHATLGMIVFCLAMAAVVLATYSNWFKNRVSAWPARIIMWVPIVLAVCVMRQVSQAYIPRMFVERESELDAKARAIQEKVEAKLKKAAEKKAQKEAEKGGRAATGEGSGISEKSDLDVVEEEEETVDMVQGMKVKTQ